MLPVDKWKSIGRLRIWEAETGSKDCNATWLDLRLFNSFSSEDYGINFILGLTGRRGWT